MISHEEINWGTLAAATLITLPVLLVVIRPAPHGHRADVRRRQAVTG